MREACQECAEVRLWIMDLCDDYSLDDLRRNHLARPAPGCEAVEDEKRVLVFQRLVEVRLPADVQISLNSVYSMTSSALRETSPQIRAHSRGEVVYAFLAHCGGIGEESRCEERSI